MNILEEFWYGNIEPAEYDTSSGKEYKELLRAGVPSPNSFQCAVGSEEDYHFKDAGWFSHDKTDLIDKSPYAEKVKKNIKKLELDYKYDNGFGDI